MKLLIDVEKIPRPERSGVISMIVFYVLATGLGDIANARFMRAATSWSDLLCWVLPCSLLSFPRDKQPKEEQKPEHFEVTPLVFGKGAGKPICACHVDIEEKKHLTHIHWQQEPTCDSNFPSPWERKGWFVADKDGEVIVDIPPAYPAARVTEGRVRWHCTERDDRD